MSPKNASISFLTCALLAISGTAQAEAWEEVYQPSPQSDGRWAEIECESGPGWQKCEKSEPVLTCKYNPGYNEVTQGGGGCRGNPGFGQTRYRYNGYIWDFNRQPAVLSIGAFVKYERVRCRGETARKYFYEICIEE